MNAARASAAEERVADADVAGSSEVVPGIRGNARERWLAANFVIPRHLETTPAGAEVRGRVGNEAREQRTGEIGMVQNVEEFRPQLHLHAFSDGRVFVESEVPLFVGRPHQRIAPQVAVVPRARNAVGSETRRPSSAAGVDSRMAWQKN